MKNTSTKTSKVSAADQATAAKLFAELDPYRRAQEARVILHGIDCGMSLRVGRFVGGDVQTVLGTLPLYAVWDHLNRGPDGQALIMTSVSAGEVAAEFMRRVEKRSKGL